jgi:hypothetical protein
MAAGQLNAIDAQRRAQAFHQFSLQQACVLNQQARRQHRPAALYDVDVALKELAHGASLFIRAKK